MRILITNDDGVNAPGIKVLREHLLPFGDIHVVAPNVERSVTGHHLTLDRPLKIKDHGQEIYSCDGYPADCINLGLGHILKDKKVDLVVSGINSGPNLGQDIYYSGTVAGAREATFHGVKSIAISVAKCINVKNDLIHYETAGSLINQLMEIEIFRYIENMCLLNINVPNLPEGNVRGIKISKMGFRKYALDIDKRMDGRNRPYYWINGSYEGFEGAIDCDCDVIEQEFVSLTPLKLFKQNYDIEGDWDDILRPIHFGQSGEILS